jgi:hypothetical protein
MPQVPVADCFLYFSPKYFFWGGGGGKGLSQLSGQQLFGVILSMTCCSCQLGGGGVTLGAEGECCESKEVGG